MNPRVNARPGKTRTPRDDAPRDSAAQDDVPRDSAAQDGDAAPGPGPGADDGDSVASAPADTPSGTPRGRTRPLRRTPLVVTAAVLVVVTAAAAAADVLIERTARQHIVHAAICRLRPTGPVSASLSGSLAGLRMLTGEVGTVHIEARDVRRNGTALSVTAELHHVTTKGTTSGGTATATIPYAELRKRLGDSVAGLSPGTDGHGGLVLTGTLAGIPLPVTVQTRITTAAGSLTVRPTSVSLLGQDFPVDRLAAQPDTKRLAGRLEPRTVKTPQLPGGVVLTGAHAGDDGLDLTLSLPRTIASAGSKGCAA